MKNYLLQFRILFTILFSTSISIPAVQAQNWAQVLKAVAADREDKTTSGRSANDGFGSSVAISGDYAVVGASNEADDSLGGNPYQGAGAAYLFHKEAGTWKKIKKLVGSDRFSDSRFGWSVAIDGNYVVVGAFSGSFAGSMNFGYAFIFRKDQGGSDNWGEVKKISAPFGSKDDNFGISVSISNEYVIVGAPMEDEDSNESATLENSGSAYIFKKDFGGSDNWGFIQKITAPIRGQDDNFGRSVAISGEVAVVGAFHEDEDASENNQLDNAGSAYIFKKDPGSEHWSLLKKITAPVRTALDIFGTSVAIKGDNIIVGAPGDSEMSGATQAGAAYIFNKYRGGPDNWGAVKKLVAFDRSRNDYLATSVSISDNFAIAGAYFDSKDGSGQNPVSNTGSAYIFRKNKDGSEQWGLSKKVTSSIRNSGNTMGYSVAADGNYAISSAIFDKLDGIGNKPLAAAGSAYLFTSDPSAPDEWATVQQIAASTGPQGKRYGASVASSGQFTIVGAANDGNQNMGAAYILQNISGTWTQIKKLTAANRNENDNFGIAVSISQDYAVVGAYGTNGYKGMLHVFKKDAGGANNWGLLKEIAAPDGTNYFGLNVSVTQDNILAGTSLESTGFGSAHVYNKNYGGTDNWGYIQKIAPSILNRQDQFGVAVHMGYDTLLVGTASDGRENPGGFSSSGAVYVFAKNFGETANWNLIKKLVPTSREEGDLFGTSVFLNGNFILVGAMSSQTDAAGSGTNIPGAGAVYMFRLNMDISANWFTKKLTAPARSANAYFGYNISGNSNYAVIGAAGESLAPGNVTNNQTGAAYIYKNYGYNVWNVIQKINNPLLSQGDYFGNSVAINGRYIFAGAPGAQEDATEKNTVYQAGATYVFMDTSPLPVTLSSFEVKKSENQARLTWTTTSETNSDYFEIQKSQDGLSWETIGNVPAATQSELLKNYIFTDARPYSGENLYRLKMVDTDQKFAYSRIKSLSFDGFGIAVFPNPVVNRFFFTGSEISRIASVNIINSQGTVVGKYNKITTDGIDAAHLAAGTYLVRINKTDGSTQINKIAIVH